MHQIITIISQRALVMHIKDMDSMKVRRSIYNNLINETSNVFTFNQIANCRTREEIHLKLN